MARLVRVAFVVGALVVSVVAWAWMGGSARAVAASGDRGATAVFVHAVDSFAGTQAARIGATVTGINREVAKIGGACPSVLANAPRGKQLEGLAKELSGAVLFSGAIPDRSAALIFAREISGLRWHESRIGRLVRALASEERAIASLVIPDVCADLRAWVASGYRTLSRDTVVFLKQANAIGRGVGPKEESLSDAVLRLLAPQESPRERLTAKHAQHLEETAGKRALQAFARAMQAVERALG